MLPARVEERARRAADRGRRAPRQVPGAALDDGSALVMHLRMTGNLLIRPGGDGDAVADLMEVERLGRAAPVRVGRRARATCAPGSCSTTGPSSGSPTRGGSATAWCSARRRSTSTSPRGSGSSRSSGALTPAHCCELAAGRTAPLKSFLLNQARVAGIGNIYADEALFARACIRSRRPARCASSTAEELVDGIVGALEAGLANGGSSIDDYRDARGERGSMQDEFLVHTREGEECLRCGGDDPADRGRRALDLLLPGLPDAAAAPAAAAAGDGDERARAAARRAFASATGPTPSGVTGCTVVIAPAGLARRGRRARGRAGDARDRRDRAARGDDRGDARCRFAGGSAYGLAAADGVMRWCEEHGLRLRDPGRAGADRPGGDHLRPGRRAIPAARPDAAAGVRGVRGGGRRGSRARAGGSRAPARRSASSTAASARRPAGIGYAARAHRRPGTRWRRSRW